MRVLRGGLFERVSTEEQSRFGFSIQAQVEALEEYCKNNKIKIVDHYCDEGVSGGKPYQQRPEMKRLLDDVQAGKIDIILFTKLDRWFRNVSEYFKVQEILDKHKVEWKAIWEDYDTTTANGRMSITIFLAIAENEREKTSERIKAVFDSKRRRKESFFGWNSTPLGYKEEPDENGIMRLVKDPRTEAMMQDFWDIAVKYDNVYKAGHHAIIVHGSRKAIHKWHELSKQEIYTGTYRGVEDFCPAYVSREDWLRLKERKSIKPSTKNKVYLFTGLFRCPNCGKNLFGQSSRQKLKNGTTKYYKFYRCGNRTTCGFKHAVMEMSAEKWLLENITGILENEIAEVEIARTAPKPKPKTNIASIKERLRRLDVIYMAGNKSDEEYIKEQDELKALLKEAESEVVDDRGDKDIDKLKSILETDFKSLYDDLHDEDKRRFWRNIIKKIDVKGCKPASVELW